MNTILGNKWVLKAAALALFGGLALSGPAAKADVLATGQTECWDEVGNSVLCVGTGQDGEYQMGVKPGRQGRFKDKGNGTVEDLLTGLIWLQDADCFGLKSWQEALNEANTLKAGFCGLTDRSKKGDWRLPNINELHSLIDYGFVAPALSNAAGNGQWSPGNAFLKVVSSLNLGDFYWSSTSIVNPSPPNYSDTAWIVYPDFGGISGGNKMLEGYVWPVRGGR